MKFTRPIRRKNTARGHYYADAEGRRVPGVTTILGNGVPKPALINWAANTTADWAVNHWDELATKPVAARLKELQGARYAEKDLAANRGTEVHRYAEKLIADEEVQVPDELAGHVEACARFLNEFDFKAEHVEFSIASYRHGYAGTGDWIGTVQLPSSGRDVPAEWLAFAGKRIRLLGDFKTNRSGIFAETALQLAAYRYADVLIATDGEQPMPQVDACAAVHIRGDGYSLIPVTADQQVHRLFLYAQQVARLDSEGRDLVGAAVTPPITSTYRLVRETQP